MEQGRSLRRYARRETRRLVFFPLKNEARENEGYMESILKV
jgi:hypothetical protein